MIICFASSLVVLLLFQAADISGGNAFLKPYITVWKSLAGSVSCFVVARYDPFAIKHQSRHLVMAIVRRPLHGAKELITIAIRAWLGYDFGK